MAEKQGIEQIGFFKVFNGEVGHMVDKEEEFVHSNGDKVRFLEESFEVNGKEVCVGDVVCGYDDRSDPEDDDSELVMKFDVDQLVLCQESGYRGEGCYWGMYYDEENKRWLAIDFVSEGLVYTLE